MMRKFGALLWVLALLAGCASVSGQGDALQKAQYAYSAAIRWGDFEGAWNMVDPDYRKAHPMSDLEFERYKQLQISAYQDLGAQVTDDRAQREIQIGIINRNTLVERDARYTERWRYDPAAKTWWIVGGLPDLWQSP
jgi:uncharacterized protein YceK